MVKFDGTAKVDACLREFFDISKKIIALQIYLERRPEDQIIIIL